MSELEFNPPTTMPYGDGISVESLIRKIGEAENRFCDPWIGTGSPACYSLHSAASEYQMKGQLQVSLQKT